MSTMLPFVSEREYRMRHGITATPVVAGQVVEAPFRRLVPERMGPTFAEGQPFYTFPAVSISDLGSATARGASNLVTTDDAIIHHDLYDLSKDVVPEVFSKRLRLSQDHASAEWVKPQNGEVTRVGRASLLMDALSHNYAHWLTETLPKAAALAHSDVGRDCELLVDDKLPGNLLTSLELLLGGKERIRRVPADARVQVERLICVSPVGYVPFKRHSRAQAEHSHGRFSPGALKLMVDTLRRKLREKSVTAGPFSSRLFIRRRAHVRNLVNSDDIERELVSRGFSVIVPEELSFEEQVVAFSGADIVVGATGSGIANLVFCPRDCVVVILIPNFAHTPYWYWRMMAGSVGVETVHVAGDQLNPTPDAMDPHAPHADFAIPPQDVISAVESVRATSRLQWAS